MLGSGQSLLGLLVLGETVRILLSYQAFHSGADISSTLLACLVEVSKLGIATIALLNGRFADLVLHRRGDSTWHQLSSYFGFFVPAVLFLINNVLYLVGLNLGEPALLQAFVMSKLPLTAVIHHFAVRRQKNKHAWAALLLIGVGLGQMGWSSVMSGASRGGKWDSINTLQTPIFGVIIGLNSAGASIWTEKMLKSNTPFWVAQFYLYAFGAALSALLATAWDGHVHTETEVPVAHIRVFEPDRSTLIFYMILVPLTTCVGLIVATILRQRDNLVKLVGSSACIVTVFISQVILYPALRHKSLDPHSVCGVGLLAIGTYAFNHFKDAYIPKRGATSNNYDSLTNDEERDSPQISPRDRGARWRPSSFGLFDVEAWRVAWSPFLNPLAAVIAATFVLTLYDARADSTSSAATTAMLSSLREAAQARSAVHIADRITFSADGLSKITLNRVSWLPEPGRIGDFDVMTMRHFCVEGTEEFPSSRKYWLSGSEDIDDIKSVRPGLEGVFQGVFFHDSKGQHRLGVKNLAQYSGSVTWIKEPTLFYGKNEVGNHPAATMRVWANYVSLATSAPEILESAGLNTNSFIQRYQVIDEAFEPNSWTSFMLDAAHSAVYETLPGRKYGDALRNLRSNSTFQSPNVKNQPAPSNGGWHDESDFVGPGKTGLYCFEKAIKVRQFYAYFRDGVDAEILRRTGLALLGRNVPRLPACKATDLRVVFLDRNRPVYNLERLKEIVKAAGPTVIVRTIDASVPHTEQVFNFHDADILFSVHGSHLNNQLFMEPTSTLIEMFPHGFEHDEQQRLSNHTGITHIELLNNPYPELDEVRAVGGETFVTHIERCQRLAKEFGDYDSCLHNYGCRSCHRSLGVKAHEDEFQQAIESAIQSLLSLPHCR